MTRASFIIAPQVGVSDSISGKRVVKRLRTLFSAVEARGCRAAMLAPKTPIPGLKGSTELAGLLGEEAPDCVHWVEMVTSRDAYYMQWPKDGFCDWDTFVAVANAPGLAAYVATFGKPTICDDALSEGGMFVRSEGCVLISSALDDKVGIPNELESIRLPHPYCSDLYRRHQPEPHPLTHLDLDVALVPCKETTLFLVSERYLSSYQGHIVTAAALLGLEVIGIPQAEVNNRGLNLVVLSERAVLIPANCPMLFGLLSDHLGSESVIEVEIDDDFNYNGGRGGLGCMSNVVQCERKYSGQSIEPI